MEYKVKCCGNCYHYHAKKKVSVFGTLVERNHQCTAKHLFEGNYDCPLNLFDEMRCADYKPASKRHLIKNMAILSSHLCVFQAIKNEPCKHHKKDGTCLARDKPCRHEKDYEKCHRYEI